MSDEDQLAETRRIALQKAMDDAGIAPADLARRAGLSGPNIIYNFLRRRTLSLNARTYDKILPHLPNITINELLGERAKRSSTPSPVLMKTICQAGAMRESFTLPPHMMRELPLPVDDSARVAGAYAALVKHPGAEQIYPAGALLLVLPISRFDGELGPGRRLIVERMDDPKIEVTVREIQADAEGKLWLSQRSNDPRFQAAIKLPKALDARFFQSFGERYVIAGVVIGAFVPEQ